MAKSDDGDGLKPVRAFISGCFWELPSENSEPYFQSCIHALCKDCKDQNDSHERQRHKDTSRPAYKCKICSFEVQHQTQVDFATELREMIPQVLQLWTKVFDNKISCGKCKRWLYSWAKYCEQCRCRLCLSCERHHDRWHKVSRLYTHVLNEIFYGSHISHENLLEIHCVGCAKSSCIACFIENDQTVSAMINSDYEEFRSHVSLLRKNLGVRKEQFYQEKQNIRREEEFLSKEIDKQVNDRKNRVDMWGRELKEQAKSKYKEIYIDLESRRKEAMQIGEILDDKLLNSPILQGKEIVDYLCKRKHFLQLKDDYNECTQQNSPISHLCLKVSDILNLSNEDIFGTLQERQYKPPLDADKYDDSTKSLVENICSKVVKREILEEILSISQNQHSFGATKPFEDDSTKSLVENICSKVVKMEISEEVLSRSQNQQSFGATKSFEDIELTINKTIDEYHDMINGTKRQLERLTSAISKEENNYEAFVASLSILEKSTTREFESIEYFCGLIAFIYGRGKLSSSLQSKITKCAMQVDEQRKMLQRAIEQLKQPTPTAIKKHGGQSYAQFPKMAPLANLGNTCFMNAVVQALFHTKIFARLLYMRFSKYGDKRDATLAESFVELSSQMQSGMYADVYPTDLYATLNTLLRKFTDSNQHDSHDFFIQFLNKIRQEERDGLSRLRSTSREGPILDPKTTLTAVDKIFGGHTLTVYICLQCKTPYHITEPFLSVSLPISGQTTQHSSRRDDGSRKQNKDKDWNYQPNNRPTAYERAIADAMKPLSGVPAGEPGSSKNSVISSLRNYTRLEHIDNEYLCTKCNEEAGDQERPTMTKAKKRTLIYTAPAILTVHLKRFTQTTSGSSGFVKINDHIAYEHFLDIAPFCSSGCLNVDPSQGNIWYMLYAVVVHSGSLNSGHYVAYVLVRDGETDITDFLQKRFLDRNERFCEEEIIKNMKRIHEVQKKFTEKPKGTAAGTWYRISDNKCDVAKSYSGTSYDEVLNQQAYMLFYERMPSAP